MGHRKFDELYISSLADGALSLDEVRAELAAFARQLRKRARDGWRLNCAWANGVGFISREAPVESITHEHCVARDAPAELPGGVPAEIRFRPLLDGAASLEIAADWLDHYLAALAGLAAAGATLGVPVRGDRLMLVAGRPATPAVPRPRGEAVGRRRGPWLRVATQPSDPRVW